MRQYAGATDGAQEGRGAALTGVIARLAAAAHHELHLLRRPGWKLPAFLDRAEMCIGQCSVQQRCGKDVCGRNGVLNREVDAHAAHRRHRVRGIADAQHAGRPPCRQAIHAHVQKMHLIPTGDFLEAFGRQRSYSGKLGS